MVGSIGGIGGAKEPGGAPKPKALAAAATIADEVIPGIPRRLVDPGGMTDAVFANISTNLWSILGATLRGRSNADSPVSSWSPCRLVLRGFFVTTLRGSSSTIVSGSISTGTMVEPPRAPDGKE
ncbi:hypothetical protein T265_00187 [Opisthorchis viverrini]|uniref:Uncharacterized protein n=1 Tax=Opisthorchis viverrini TaxID=6198 RepID=A0A075A6I8_OPIVI|nr:hypothetical protein T265_00187 [Opisthorchis viverrini]KER33982.1 hypothetical protein T265_00187 [Opisthorchis viverrini]